MYLNKEVKEAMLWLRENTNEEDVILSSLETGNLIPAISLRQVYLGHLHGTAQAEEKLARVERFFKKGSDAEKQTCSKIIRKSWF